MITLQGGACGKLNLTLDILGQRADGYHELEMVMCSVDLCDRLTLSLETGRPWSVVCDRPGIPDGAGNLCWKAAKAFFDAAGCSPNGISIEIQKAIPAQAGMAGGSSDAAAVLRLLNEHYRCFTETQLRSIGLTVGSDVPYCLFGGVALAKGRGEVLSRLSDLPAEACFVLVKPDFAISTPALFRTVDAVGVTARPDNRAMEAALAAGDLPAVGRLLENAFEPPVSEAYPVVQDIRRALLDCGALGARLTGTGSVVFGLFDDAQTAGRAALALQAAYPEVHAVRAVP